MKYTDPSGHDKKSNECGPDGIYCDNSVSFEEKYGISFSGEWGSNDKVAVMSGIKAVAAKMGAVSGINGAFVWGQVFGNIDFSMGCSATDCGNVGGMTLDSHHITFSALDSGYLRARNNVVHELGHAFDAGHASRPSTILGYTQTQTPGYEEFYKAGFPNRPDFPANHGPEWVGDYYGFASKQNQFTWQMSYSNAGSTSEEFADQFLGWTFNTWDTSPGQYNGQMRSDWMNKYMVGWLP